MVKYHPLPVRRRHIAVIQHISVIKYWCDAWVHLYQVSPYSAKLIPGLAMAIAARRGLSLRHHHMFVVVLSMNNPNHCRWSSSDKFDGHCALSRDNNICFHMPLVESTGLSWLNNVSNPHCNQVFIFGGRPINVDPLSPSVFFLVVEGMTCKRPCGTASPCDTNRPTYQPTT